MCGIAGVFHGQAPQDVVRMLGKISHRGPVGRRAGGGKEYGSCVNCVQSHECGNEVR